MFTNLLRFTWLGLATLSFAFSAQASEQWGVPLDQAATDEWQWVADENSFCRDGSPAGFFVRHGPDTTKLMIYLEGGGACFNDATCNINPSRIDGNHPPQEGILSHYNEGNPTKDWNMVYVPYCTGDLHAGNNENVWVSNGVQNQQFVGYRNLSNFLSRITPSFDEVDQVLLTGVSAGAMGALYNFDQVQTSFGDIPVDMLNDSGVAQSDRYLATCLQRRWRNLWNLDSTLPFDCVDCTRENGGGLSNIATHIAEKFPDRNFAYYSTLQDQVIRLFMGYGRNNCRVLVPFTSAGAYRAGLFEVRDQILKDTAVFYYIEGTFHTAIRGQAFYDVETHGVRLNNWVGDFIEGLGQSLGPHR